MNPPSNGSAGASASRTSRAAFRSVAKALDATNREADWLRLGLLTLWAEHHSVEALNSRLETTPSPDDGGLLAAEAQLDVWLSFAEPKVARASIEDAPALDRLSAALHQRLAKRFATAEDPGPAG